MPNDLAHFAIHADDCQRAKTFYETVFEWTFEPWGPPNFWLIRTSPEAVVHGALQERREPVTGTGMNGFECSVAVDDVNVIADLVREHGGSVTQGPFEIERVGTLIMIEDTEGNTLGAMQYLESLDHTRRSG